MISENLYTLRKRIRLSQEEVAEQIGVSRQAVAKWENGDTTPDIMNCMALAELYDVSLDDLVSYSCEKSGGLPLPPKGKYMFGTVTVGEKGQIVIPVKARKIFGIKPGDTLVVLGDVAQGLALLNADFMMDMLKRLSDKANRESCGKEKQDKERRDKEKTCRERQERGGQEDGSFGSGRTV